jgi:predicted nucleic acid-binding Zn ribbon protein
MSKTCAWCGKESPDGDSYCSDECANSADAESDYL